MLVIITILRPLVWAACRLFFRIEFQGIENIPLSGPCVMTPNHFTYLDPVWITIPVRRRVYYMAWDKPFRIPVLGQMMRIFCAFPVRLEGSDASAQRTAVDLLRRGKALIVFPEGGRSHTEKMMPFKMGAFRLALTHGAPIVPVTIKGGFEIWPVGRILPRPGRLRVSFHPAVRVDQAPDAAPVREVKQRARSLALEVHAIVASALDTSAISVDSASAPVSDHVPE